LSWAATIHLSLVLTTIVANHVAQEFTGRLCRFAVRCLHARVVFDRGLGAVAVTSAAHTPVEIAITIAAGIAITVATGITVAGIAVTLPTTIDAVATFVTITAAR
jgi:hypothetical protein